MSLTRRRALVTFGAVPAVLAASSAFAKDAKLATAIADARRPAGDKARDQYRHPQASLEFWGLKPGMTVIDVSPGAGYWTYIVAPYLAKSHGRYIGTGADLTNPAISEAARKDRAEFEAKFADHAVFGDVSVAGFGRVSGPLAPPGTVDMVIATRETHNWVGGFVTKAFGDFNAALKKGGVLAIEDHRAPEGSDPAKGNGYIPESWVIDQAQKAGFRLAGRSEINANPRDTKDHPFGVWTLPPTRRSAPQGQPADPTFDHTKYDAIGESDRMTLKFLKV